MELMIFTIELPEKVKRGLLINIFYTLANVLPYVYLKDFLSPPVEGFAAYSLLDHYETHFVVAR